MRAKAVEKIQALMSSRRLSGWVQSIGWGRVRRPFLGAGRVNDSRWGTGVGKPAWRGSGGLGLALVMLAWILGWPKGYAQDQLDEEPADLVAREAWTMPPTTGNTGRAPLPTDAWIHAWITGAWSPERPDQGFTDLEGRERAWTRVRADEEGRFPNDRRGSLALMTLTRDTPEIRLLDIEGHLATMVNGESHVGDIYGTLGSSPPIALPAGRSWLVVQRRGGPLSVRLRRPPAPVFLDPRDPTTPDLIVGSTEPTHAAVIVINASHETRDGQSLRVRGDWPGARSSLTELPSLPPLSFRKVGFRIDGPFPDRPGPVKLTVELIRGRDPALEGGTALGQANDPTRLVLTLQAVSPDQTHKRTFISNLDGSVQYYGVVPPVRSLGDLSKRQGSEPPAAMVLSLHGASVEAIDQARSYAPKTWCRLIAPTNRRPYGFDWEDWGRLDALEVLDEAQRRFPTDPARVYLTGHSMGGHGTWHLGVHAVDRFAAIGPSAGWLALVPEGGLAERLIDPAWPEETRRAAEFVVRGSNPSDTLTLATNLTDRAIYGLHGDADDNVSVNESRRMAERLREFHRDWTIHEQPGAGHWWDVEGAGVACVDWTPMFDLFARRRRPDPSETRRVRYATYSPAVGSGTGWGFIEAQSEPYQLSAIDLTLDPIERKIVGTTANVSRLRIELGGLALSTSGRIAPLTVELDGTTLRLDPDRGPDRPPAQRMWLARRLQSPNGTPGGWQVIPQPGPELKNPERQGGFKQAFTNRAILVYGTQGTPEANAWALAKARYDAETFWYRGNGSLDVIADVAFRAGEHPDRNVVLYGGADLNAAWNAVLGPEAPLRVERGGWSLGRNRWRGDDFGVLAVLPRRGGSRGLVGVVAGTGLPGMRALDRLPVFISGVQPPDLLAIGPESWRDGLSAVRAAGFFGEDWSVETGRFAFPTPPQSP